VCSGQCVQTTYTQTDRHWSVSVSGQTTYTDRQTVIHTDSQHYYVWFLSDI